jgi:hypothetical protein
LTLAIIIFLPAHLSGRSAKTNPTTPIDPANPLSLGELPNYTKPVRNSLEPRIGAGYTGKEANPVVKQQSLFEPGSWTFSLSGTYDFLNDRSRIGGISLDSESAVLDFAAYDRYKPWTSFDLSYMYSYASGTAPGGTKQTGSQNVGGLRVLQPIPYDHWKPANLTTSPTNNQVALLFSADYGRAFSSINIPQLPTIRGSARTFLADALFDYQFAWFKERDRTGLKKSDDRKLYPSLLV